MRLYRDLANWFHLLTAPFDYEEEARFTTEVFESLFPGAQTLLELGSGGGNNASWLKQRYQCTLTDISEEMLEQSRKLNPECEHIQGDMRTLRLGRAFDLVFVHDAVDYMLTEEDLAAAIRTAFDHLVPGGVALFTPDCTRESMRLGMDDGGHDGPDGRALRYLEWTTDPDPNDTTYDFDLAIMLKEPGKPMRVEHDHHTVGVFPRATWHRLFREADFESVETNVKDPYEGQHEVFVVRKPA